MMVPLQKIIAAGYKPVFTNPSGVKPAMDPLSDSSVWFGLRKGAYESAKRDLETLFAERSLGSLSFPIPFSQVSDYELMSYKGIFIPGGHAPMVDLGNNSALGRILKHFHDNSKLTATICHGPISLMSTKWTGDGAFLYQGYKMTAYSNWEEGMMELMWRGSVPFTKLEDQLRAEGADFHSRYPMLSNLIVDRELVTGQNPSSSWALGDAMVASLNSYNPNAQKAPFDVRVPSNSVLVHPTPSV